MHVDAGQEDGVVSCVLVRVSTSLLPPASLCHRGHGPTWTVRRPRSVGSVPGVGAPSTGTPAPTRRVTDTCCGHVKWLVYHQENLRSHRACKASQGDWQGPGLWGRATQGRGDPWLTKSPGPSPDELEEDRVTGWWGQCLRDRSHVALGRLWTARAPPGPALRRTLVAWGRGVEGTPLPVARWAGSCPGLLLGRSWGSGPCSVEEGQRPAAAPGLPNTHAGTAPSPHGRVSRDTGHKPSVTQRGQPSVSRVR